MKTALEQLSTYKAYHLNGDNVKTHFAGIPAIVYGVVVILSMVPVAGTSLAVLLAMSALTYYFLMNRTLAIGMALFFIPVLYLGELTALMSTGSAVVIALVAFVGGWALQFLGHKFEGKKPAFVDDLNQLLIGPYFLMAEIYFALGLLPELNEEVERIGVAKRREIDGLAPEAGAAVAP